MTPVIRFSDVVASRGGRSVLRGVSLDVGDGEVVALVGRSGSGKTTLLRLVNRLLDPDSGDVQVEGRSGREWDMTALRRRTGYAIQDVGLFPHMSVAANIAVVPRLLEWDSARIDARVTSLLTIVGLDPATYRDRYPDELSGGQRQRVGLARALAGEPRVLLMDEPFGALDPITRAELHQEFQRIRAQIPIAVLLVTHDLGEAFALADRIAVLHEGRIIACAAPEELSHSQDPHVRALIATRFA